MPSEVFVGRSREQAIIASAVADAMSGRPWVVSIEGAGGTGKSALVRQSIANFPAEFVVRRVVGDDITQDQPFGAVRAQFEATTASPFACGMEVLAALGDLQSIGPVALVVEDLHWVDAQSRQALVTTARRLDRDRVIVLVTTRTDDETFDDGWHRMRFDADRCRRLALGPLSWEECARWAAATGKPLHRTAAERLVRHADGHPLHLQTLLGELSHAQLASPTTDLPVPRSLASAVLARIAGLSPVASALIEALAVLDGRASVLAVAEVAGISEPASAVDEAVSTGFIERRDADASVELAFAHPLYRVAVYDDVSMRRRQQLHRAAAAVTTATASLTHRVAASDRRDDRLADELDAAARSAIDVGNRTVAARYLMWSAELAERPLARQQRLLRAAQVLLEGWQHREAGQLRDRIEQCAPSPLRDRVLGLMAAHAGDTRRAERLLRAAAGGDEPDAAVAAAAWVQLAEFYAAYGRGQDAIDAVHRALETGVSDVDTQQRAMVTLADGTALVAGAVAGLAVLDERLSDDQPIAAGVQSVVAGTQGILQFYAGRMSAAVTSLGSVIDWEQRGVFNAHLTIIRSYYAMALACRGDWDEALVHANTAVSLADDEGQLFALAHAHAAAATVWAGRGAWDDAQRHVDAAIAAAQRVGNVDAELWSALAQAALARARGDADAVVRALAPLERGRRDNDVPMYGWHWWPTLIGALIDTGRLDDATSSLERMEAVTAILSLDVTMRLQLLRGRIAAARHDDDAAEHHFTSALELSGRDDPWLDRALLHVERGRLAAERGNRREGVEELTRGRELLAAVGASPYVERVDRLLVESGAPRAADPATASRLTDGLTDRERDVASMVAKGYTNREVAAALYVSSKAVEYHLRHVFQKLHVTSRRQLRGLAT